MSCERPSIIWPAPGFPAFLEADDQYIDLIVGAGRPDSDALSAWAQRITLCDRAGGSAIPTTVECIAKADAGAIADRAGQFASLPQAAGLCFFRVGLRIAQAETDEAGRTVRVLDLLVNGVVERPRSVAVFRHRSTTLNLAFACDLHVAKLFDEIAAAVECLTPEAAVALPGSTRLLDRFIDEANALAARGRLDLVVFGGDLVDHVRIRSRGKGGSSKDDTNVGRLLTLLGRLEVPTLVIPGNHDHRCFPPRPRHARIQNGFSRKQQISALRKAGMWDHLPLRLSDRDCLRTADTDGTPGLGEHLVQLSPATDYCCSVRGLRLCFLSTGRDLLTRWQEIETARLGLLLRGLPTAADHPNSEAFSEAQVARIRGWLQQDNGGTALFFHAPLLSPGAVDRMNSSGTDLDPGPQESMPARIAFERRIHRAGFGSGVSFRNPGLVLRELAAAAGPIVTFSGHLHRAGALEIDRHTMKGHSIDICKAVARPQTFTLLTGPALGQSGSGNAHGPGYLLARFERGALVAVEQRSLKSWNFGIRT